MKKILIPLLFIYGFSFSQQKETPTFSLETKNELKFYTYGGYTGSIGIEYERLIKEDLAISLIYRTGPDIPIEENYPTEKFGIGLKAIKYLGEYKSPYFWRAFFSNSNNIQSRPFIELAAVYAKYESNKTITTLDNDDVFIIERKNKKFTNLPLHIGLGCKYIIHKRIATQISVGYEHNFAKQDLENSPYISFTVGYRF